MVKSYCYQLTRCRRNRPYFVFNPPAYDETANDESSCFPLSDVCPWRAYGFHLYDGYSIFHASAADVLTRRHGLNGHLQQDL